MSNCYQNGARAVLGRTLKQRFVNVTCFPNKAIMLLFCTRVVPVFEVPEELLVAALGWMFAGDRAAAEVHT